MTRLRWRLAIQTLALVGAIWAVALMGFSLARDARVTPEKLLAFTQQTDLSQLRGEARAKALRELARQLNALPMEDRRRARLDGSIWSWFEKMTEEEKAQFVEATLPTGMRQMLSAFEELPDDRRHRAIDDALKRLRQAGNEVSSGAEPGEQAGTNSPSLSPELEARIRTIGLKTFYSQSSAQTRAELAPVLEELQRAMQSGRMLDRRRRP
jgi:hypothetical protein